MDEQWENNVKLWMKEHQIEMIDLNLIKDALTHSSYKGMGYNVRDNERLEFLGDSVLDLLIAHQLFLNPQLSEGDMTEKRKDFVSNEKLALIFDDQELDQIVRTANNFTLSENNKAGFIEALFGAVFLNRNYNRCCEFWEKINKGAQLFKNIYSEGSIDKTNELQQEDIFDRPIEEWQFSDQDYKDAPQEIAKLNKNAKNMIQEYCQKRSLPKPEYTLISKEGSDHEPIFTVEVSARVIINGKIEIKTANGMGSTKKSAEIKAAEKICDILKLNYSTQ